MAGKLLLLGVCLAVVCLIAAPSGAAVITERISLTDFGGSPNGASWWPAFSSDGRYVAFYSGAGNIVAGDTNHVYDVFLRDRFPGGTVELVSVSSLGQIGNGASIEPAMSRDARYVAFPTTASNLVPGDTNNASDIVVRDRLLGLTYLASISPTAGPTNGDSLWASISDDGRYVAFQSSATNLIEGGNPWPGVYVRDMEGGVECISLPDEGGHANNVSIKPVITPDGRYVAYRSYATNLVDGDTNGFSDVFVHDRVSDLTERVSVANGTGAQGNGETAGRPAISSNGRYVVFSSVASNLVFGDTNGKYDVFIRDRNAGLTERVSVSTGGEQGNDDSAGDSSTSGGQVTPAPLMAVSDDGRYVAFASLASNLTADDTNGKWDVFVRDRAAHTTQRVSVSTAGAEGNDNSGIISLAMTPDGQTVGFDSVASNLVLIDVNRTPDVFVRGEPLAPTPPMLVINGGAEYTTSADVTLSIDPGSYAELRFKDEGGTYTDWETAVFTKAWTLPVGDGLKRIYVQGRNGGDLSVEDYAEITLDTNAPTGLSISINDGDGSTISRTVTLHLSASGASQMRFRNETSGWSDWRAISSSSSWKLSHDRGTKTVGFQCRDAAGNTAAEVTDTIDLICFTDMCTGYWSFEEIMACVDANVVQGYAEGDYKPTLEVSRDQMAVYVSRAIAGGNENVPPGPASPTFTDVPADYWAYDAIEYAASNSIVQGYEDGSYQPLLPVDRAQMAVYIAHSITTPLGEDGLADYTPPAAATFPDVATDFWAFKHIEYNHDQAVVQGYEDGLYHPEIVVTRDQMAVYIARAFDLLGD